MPKEFAYFLQTLETHEDLLQAETQAIAAKDLDTIESILGKKEESLQVLLQAKDDIGVNPRSVKKADELIERVLELQKRNADSFKRMVDQQSEKKKEEGDSREKPIDQRLKKAYRAGSYLPKTRLDF